MKLKVLDLFSGIGGFSLGLERTGGFETVAFCEIEEFPRKVLAKHWPGVPIHRDVRELTADAVGHIDLICGGYPCQPFSHAGQRRGAEDDRHLWPEVKRLVASIRPRWCLFENVAGHISMGLDEVLSDLESEGYTAWPVVIPACAVDAPHRRDRVWVLASNSECLPSPEQEREYQGAKECRGSGEDGLDAWETVADAPNEGITGGQRQSGHGTGKGNVRGDRSDGSGTDDGREDVAHTSGLRIQGSEKQGSNGGIRQEPRDKQSEGRSAFGAGGSGGPAKWLPEPPVGRVAHGIPKRVDRLKGLGNAVVPQVVTMLGQAILEAEGMK